MVLLPPSEAGDEASGGPESCSGFSGGGVSGSRLILMELPVPARLWTELHQINIVGRENAMRTIQTRQMFFVVGDAR